MEKDNRTGNERTDLGYHGRKAADRQQWRSLVTALCVNSDVKRIYPPGLEEAHLGSGRTGPRVGPHPGLVHNVH